MSTAQSSAKTQTQWKPNDAWLIGIVLAVINFWLFAQTLLNVIPGIQGSLGIERTLGNLAVSITSLFSGIFIVVAGGLADRLGRVKIMYIGIYLSILGSLLIALTPENAGGLTAAALLGGRVVQGLSAACIMPSTMALVKFYYEGKDRQRALSFWSIGSWGGSGFCALFGGLMATSFLGWRSIFWISIVLSVVALFLLRGTPESKSAAKAGGRFDWGGMITLVVALVALNVYISQGPRDRLAQPDRHRADRGGRGGRPGVLRDRDQPEQPGPEPEAVRECHVRRRHPVQLPAQRRGRNADRVPGPGPGGRGDDLPAVGPADPGLPGGDPGHHPRG